VDEGGEGGEAEARGASRAETRNAPRVALPRYPSVVLEPEHLASVPIDGADAGGLNALQREAVTAQFGPVLVVAGPGTGKTRVITHRIAFLIRERGVRTSSILALTFTNKAAREMKSRAEALLFGAEAAPPPHASAPPPPRIEPWVGTFHSFCMLLLRRNTVLLGGGAAWSVVSRADQLSICRRFLSEQTEDAAPEEALSIISDAKNREVDAAALAALVKGDAAARDAEWLSKYGLEARRMAAETYRKYERYLREHGLRDFDDLLWDALRLLREHPAVRDRCAALYRHVLIDEFQDTNTLQYALIVELLRPLGEWSDRSVMAVGDPDQCIYSWRHASYENVARFRKDLAPCQLVVLEENYRSTPQIVQCCNAVIDASAAAERIQKRIRSMRPPGPVATITEYKNPFHEAECIVRRVVDLLADARQRLAPSDIAILCRASALTRHIEQKLSSRHLGKPPPPRVQRAPRSSPRDLAAFHVSGKLPLTERAEVRDALCMLRVLANPADDEAFTRIVNVPPRGLGGKSVEKLEQIARTHACSLWQACRAAVAASDAAPAAGRRAAAPTALDLWLRARGGSGGEGEGGAGAAPVLSAAPLPKKQCDALAALLAALDSAAAALDAEGATLQGVLEGLLARVSYEQHMRARFEDEEEFRAAREETLGQLLASLRQRDEAVVQSGSQERARERLARFLEDCGLDPSACEAATTPAAQARDCLGGRITVSTIHAAKGLEWRVVFLPCVERGVVPHARATTEQQVEEERRLLYVAMTRARDQLHVSYVRHRDMSEGSAELGAADERGMLSPSGGSSSSPGRASSAHASFSAASRPLAPPLAPPLSPAKPLGEARGASSSDSPENRVVANNSSSSPVQSESQEHRMSPFLHGLPAALLSREAPAGPRKKSLALFDAPSAPRAPRAEPPPAFVGFVSVRALSFGAAPRAAQAAAPSLVAPPPPATQFRP
jgi:DNA helicase-2/ATP-dependent DNA helicase PcrA